MVEAVFETKNLSPKLVAFFSINDDEVLNCIVIDNPATCALINFVDSRKSRASRTPSQSPPCIPGSHKATKKATLKRFELFQALENKSHPLTKPERLTACDFVVCDMDPHLTADTGASISIRRE